jgi:glutamine synthetase
MLCAGLNGIKNQTDPGEPLDVDIYELSPEELSKVPSTPGSLEGALENLEKDHDFLTESGVFTEDFIQNWISVQTRQGDQPNAPTSPPLRVWSLLRLLIDKGQPCRSYCY